MTGDQEANKGNGIQYTVKELLADIKDRMERIELKLDTKVDSAVTDAIIIRIRAFENMNLPGIMVEFRDAIRNISALESRLNAADAVKRQSDDISKIYLAQWETMQKDLQQNKTDISNIQTTAGDAKDWKKLWIPTLASGVIALLSLYVSLGGKL